MWPGSLRAAILLFRLHWLLAADDLLPTIPQYLDQHSIFLWLRMLPFGRILGCPVGIEVQLVSAINFGNLVVGRL